MALQGSILPDHAAVNNYELTVTGLPTFFFTEISGIELETQAVDLPDRTKASGGNVVPQEWTGKSLIHHTIEKAALEAWMREGQDPVDPAYKKTATLIHKTISGAQIGIYALDGVWIMKRKLPDLDKSNDGDPAVVEWTLSSDNISPQ